MLEARTNHFGGTTVTAWQLRIPLTGSGQTSVIVEAFDRNGVAISGASKQITITYSGTLPVNHPVINEWLASNSANLSDPADGDFEDWIEIYNPMNAVVNLSGYYLTDDLNNKTEWTIPQGTVIPPGGFLLIWADDETGQNGLFGPAADLHANFSLSAGGEAIGLYLPDQSPVDSVMFGAQTANVSQGRFPDGSGSVQAMATPTPRLPNRYP